jgi:hypothetical protein
LVKSSAILNLSAQKKEKQLVLPDIIFQITQTRFVVVNKRLRVFGIGKADNIAILWFLGTSAISTQPPKKATTVILMQPRVHGIYAAIQKTPGVDTQSVEP